MSDSTSSAPTDPVAATASADAAAIDRVIRARHTAKLMLSPEHRPGRERSWTDAHHRTLGHMIEGSAWAPFHRRANEAVHRGGELDSPLPWRFHVLEGQACTVSLRPTAVLTLPARSVHIDEHR